MNWVLLVWLINGNVVTQRFPNYASCANALNWFGRHGVNVVDTDDAQCYQDFPDSPSASGG
jgi:hypothetical protein